jgi:hypothetical protein
MGAFSGMSGESVKDQNYTEKKQKWHICSILGHLTMNSSTGLVGSLESSSFQFFCDI